MRVSVIIPTFNRAQLLPRAVESIFAQDWRPLEVVIVDDGSDDGTPDVVKSLADQAKSFGVDLIAIRQANRGDAAARNAGLHAATGEWLAFLDDDDTRHAGSLSAQLNAIGDFKAGCALVAQGDGTKPGSSDRLLNGTCAAAYLRGDQSAAITSLLVRREVVDSIGNFDDSLPIGSDMEWIARLVHHADFAALPQVVADYTFSPTALSRYQGLTELIQRDQHDLRVVDLVRQRCHTSPRFEAAAWAAFAARGYDRCIKHMLYAGRLEEAETLLGIALAKGANADAMQRTRRKLRKAKLLGLIGKRLQHPKFANAGDIHG